VWISWVRIVPVRVRAWRPPARAGAVRDLLDDRVVAVASAASIGSALSVNTAW
jgi:hypothetical protein